MARIVKVFRRFRKSNRRRNPADRKKLGGSLNLDKPIMNGEHAHKAVWDYGIGYMRNNGTLQSGSRFILRHLLKAWLKSRKVSLP